MDLRAVDGHHPCVDETGLRAQRQHLAEQAGQRLLMTLPEPRNRRVIRTLLSDHDPKGDVFLTRPLDHPRRPNPARVRVKQQPDHDRRIERRPTVSVPAVDGIKRVEIHLRDRVDHKPREVPLGQPVANIRRQEKRLLAIRRKEVLAHHQIVLTRPDGPLHATATMERDSEPARGANCSVLDPFDSGRNRQLQSEIARPGER
jgi:hypothetical protein